MTKVPEQSTIVSDASACGGCRVAIIGSRGISDYALVAAALEQAQADGLRISTVLSGGARGVDRLGEHWAHRHGVPITLFSPAWERYGRRAGIVRNVQMINAADAVVAVHTGTPGTQHALGVARTRKLPIWEFVPTPAGLHCARRPPQEEQ